MWSSWVTDNAILRYGHCPVSSGLDYQDKRCLHVLDNKLMEDCYDRLCRHKRSVTAWFMQKKNILESKDSGMTYLSSSKLRYLLKFLHCSLSSLLRLDKTRKTQHRKKCALQWKGTRQHQWAHGSLHHWMAQTWGWVFAWCTSDNVHATLPDMTLTCHGY